VYNFIILIELIQLIVASALLNKLFYFSAFK